jgi:hypothetical protein
VLRQLGLTRRRPGGRIGSFATGPAPRLPQYPHCRLPSVF